MQAAKTEKCWFCTFITIKTTNPFSAEKKFLIGMEIFYSWMITLPVGCEFKTTYIIPISKAGNCGVLRGGQMGFFVRLQIYINAIHLNLN